VKYGRLIKVTVATLLEAEEEVATLVERLFRQPVALYTDEETLRTEVSVFLSSALAWTGGKRQRLEAGLRRLRANGVPLGRTRIKSAVLPPRDWAEAWKRHFRPLDIRGRLLVLPTWSRRQPAAGQAVVRLDPGLSFGTGQHPTTAFCLEQIAANAPGANAVSCVGSARSPATDVAVRAPRSDPRSLLDIGCGSGILAIAAARLGYTPVEAFDLDPDAVRIAQENAVLNGVAGRLTVARHDLVRRRVEAARRFDVVCANLLADLLLSQAERITRFVARSGTLVLAGILASEFEAVCRKYAANGWQLTADREVKEWRSGAFRRAAEPQATTIPSNHETQEMHERRSPACRRQVHRRQAPGSRTDR